MDKCDEVFGWLEPVEIIFLKEQSKGKRCLELGSYQGKSSVCMAEGAIHLTCVDTFSADGSGQNQMDKFTTWDIFTENTKGFKNIYPIIGKTQETVPFLPDDFYDFIFIDASHSYLDVLLDIEACWPKLKIGGIMALHDYGWNGYKDGGPKKAFDQIFGLPKHKPIFSIAYTRKESNEYVG